MTVLEEKFNLHMMLGLAWIWRKSTQYAVAVGEYQFACLTFQSTTVKPFSIVIYDVYIISNNLTFDCQNSATTGCPWRVFCVKQLISC